jgi:SAM-dependent methyltransferase
MSVDEAKIKQRVREFYDQIGWQQVSEGVYQNALYEDLRPVSRRYIHDCHLRVRRHLRPQGRYLLDAGSGPIQYPEYLVYSQGYTYRVCADISIVALQEARQRAGAHGLYVVADIANLPFKSAAFEGVVSLHTIHHLPPGDYVRAYQELCRLLAPGCNAVVVNGWQDALLMRPFKPVIRLVKRARRWLRRQTGEDTPAAIDDLAAQHKLRRASTHVTKYNPAWLKASVGSLMPLKILVWRSVGATFLQYFVHGWLGGRLWLRLLFGLEERFPRFFGEKGQYPLIVITKA